MRSKPKNLLTQIYTQAIHEEICTTNFAKSINIGSKTADNTMLAILENGNIILC